MDELDCLAGWKDGDGKGGEAGCERVCVSLVLSLARGKRELAASAAAGCSGECGKLGETVGADHDVEM